jgi:hypothetical protein
MPPSSPAEGATETGLLPIRRVADVPEEPLQGPAWLIEDLWADQAVGIIGGTPKCCKTYLALEMALAVASGHPCLDRFPVPQPGPVLLFAAEDSPQQVRTRLAGLANARGLDFMSLPVFLILAQQLRLDLLQDQTRLRAAIEQYQPRLLILDPFVRLHRIDENSALEVSGLLADLRAWQRRYHLAVLLVHHPRKANGESSGGAALRGSSDLHAWGDSNLYLGRFQDKLRLAIEHRSAKAPPPLALALTGDQCPHLEVDSTAPDPEPPDLAAQLLTLLSRSPSPITQYQLRCALKVRNQSLTAALQDLLAQNKISRHNGGWILAR